MPETKSQPMPGLCAVCVWNVLAEDQHVAVVLTDGGDHDFVPEMMHGIVQDMASGEWPVMPVKTSGREQRMAAVTFVGGTAVCTDHVRQLIVANGLLSRRGAAPATRTGHG